MKSKWFQFLEGFHDIFKILGYVITWGGFLFMVIIATLAQGFPNGFILGLCVGSLFAFVSWLGFRKSNNDAAKAREKLYAYSQGHKEVFNSSNQVTYSFLASIVIGMLAIAIMASCEVYSFKNEPVRPQIFFILIGLSIAVHQLFGKERVRGKPAMVALVALTILVTFLFGKVFSFW